MKWTPNADNVIDGTIRPDFSQIESDTAQISTNQRFALFFPEKRPFFLEGVELLSTPIQAVYTRTITAPDWGGRATGKLGGVNYTALVADDTGGGSVVVPGPNVVVACRAGLSLDGVHRPREEGLRVVVRRRAHDRSRERHRRATTASWARTFSGGSRAPKRSPASGS